MKKIVWISDTHLGLMTDEIDRTEEILGVMIRAAKRAVKIKADAFVFGGDIFNDNTPSEKLIALFIRVLNILHAAGIKTFVMVGNHDAIADAERRSCLSFLRKMKKGYPLVELVDEIKTMKFCDAEVGDIWFTFLPHITKAMIGPKYSTVQQYVDFKAREILKTVPKDAQHFCFSHLNVPGAHPGSEDSMLKKVEVMIPDCFITTKLGQNRPEIIQGHIHTRQTIGNIHIIGSPMFANFGEKEKDKYFLQLNVPNWIGDGKGSRELLLTKCRPFIEWDVEVRPEDPVLPFEKKRFAIMAKELTKDAVLKINVTCTEKDAGLPWEEYRKAFAKHCFYVKPIRPRVLRESIKRNKKQTIKLSPKEAVRLFIDSHKVKKPERILSMAADYIERLQ